MLHVWYMKNYIWVIVGVNVGKYSSTMVRIWVTLRCHQTWRAGGNMSEPNGALSPGKSTNSMEDCPLHTVWAPSSDGLVGGKIDRNTPKKNLGKSKVSCTRSPKLINQSIEMAFIRFISVFIVGLQPGLLMIPPSSPTKEGSSHLVSCPSDLKCPIMPLSYFQNYDDELASHKPSLGKSPYLCLCSIPFVSHHMVILFPLISALIYRSDFPDFRLWYLKTCP